MRAVVDTNVLVSGLLKSASPPAQVLAAIVAGGLRPVLCHEIVSEYQEVLHRPRLRIRHEHIAPLLQRVQQIGDWLAVPAYTGAPPMPDPEDWPFLAAALVADCPLITGNVRHFAGVSGLQVMTPRAWVESQAGG